MQKNNGCESNLKRRTTNRLVITSIYLNQCMRRDLCSSSVDHVKAHRTISALDLNGASVFHQVRMPYMQQSIHTLCSSVSQSVIYVASVLGHVKAH